MYPYWTQQAYCFVVPFRRAAQMRWTMPAAGMPLICKIFWMIGKLSPRTCSGRNVVEDGEDFARTLWSPDASTVLAFQYSYSALTLTQNTTSLQLQVLCLHCFLFLCLEKRSALLHIVF